MPELTPIFALADRFVSESAALDPYSATSRGIAGFDGLITDWSPDGVEARVDHVRSALDELSRLEPQHRDDRVAQDYLSERFRVMIDSFEVGEWMRPLRAIAAPAATVRAAFDLMPRDGEEAWANIVSRLESVPDALAGLRASLEAGRASGVVASQRQTEVVAAQAATWSANRWFDTLTDEASARTDLAPDVLGRVRAGAQIAIEAFGAFAGYLRQDYLPDAAAEDACGPERYAVSSRAMTGADLDPAEMYEWAWHEHASLRDQIVRTCEIIRPGASFAEVRELLDTDPARSIDGVDAYREWLQAMTDEALVRSAEHFDIPAPMNRCEALIPPAGSAAAAYYTEPSEDFTRPGRTWYPAFGRTTFPMWGDVTTCYHESVPGHHLQIAYAKLQAEHLTRFQRGSFVPGHGEGWALYAERLCDELGWFEDPDHRLGFLCGQQLRAVRVIVDIGMHLGFAIPHDARVSSGALFHPGETWTPELALEFAISESGQAEDFLRSEIDRYLGWPAQAISYKIGEREWLAARADARARLGGSFDLRRFHTTALSLGPVGLAQLRSELGAAI